MTNERANEILKTKYPEAEIYAPGTMGGVPNGRIALTFDPNGKVYSYVAQNYAQVLNKLGFNVIYKDHANYLESHIETLEKEIALGGYDDIFTGEWIRFTDKEIESKKVEIAKYKSILETSIIE